MCDPGSLMLRLRMQEEDRVESSSNRPFGTRVQQAVKMFFCRSFARGNSTAVAIPLPGAMSGSAPPESARDSSPANWGYSAQAALYGGDEHGGASERSQSRNFIRHMRERLWTVNNKRHRGWSLSSELEQVFLFLLQLHRDQDYRLWTSMSQN